MSVLEFLNGCVTGSKVPQIKGPTNQPIVQIITEKDPSLTWRAIPDVEQGEEGEDVLWFQQGDILSPTDYRCDSIITWGSSWQQNMRLRELAASVQCSPAGLISKI